MSVEEIKEKINAHRKEIKSKYMVKSIAIFGSYVRGEQNKNSDIDFVIEFDSSAFGKDFTGLYDNFRDLSIYLENLLGKKVDILTPISVTTIRIKEVAESITNNLLYV